MELSKEINSKVARLETVQDHLLTELEYLDHLLRMVGFEHGIPTFKAVAEDALRQEAKAS